MQETQIKNQKTPKIRLFVDVSLHENKQVEFNVKQTHYLRNVMRLRPCENVCVFNGKDGEWFAKITKIERSSCQAVCETMIKKQTLPEDLWLAFAPIKRSRVDIIAEKATELGVDKIIPVITKNTITSRINTDRFKQNSIEAAEQSKSLHVPEIKQSVDIKALLASWDEKRTLFYMHEKGGGEPVFDVFSNINKDQPCAILVGPEGGFSNEEFLMLKEKSFAKAVNLGTNTLRAETAVISAISCWQAICGNWR